jgi:hypothetical protein
MDKLQDALLRQAPNPGRTRTCNQTVMSAVPCRKISAKSNFSDQDRARSFTGFQLVGTAGTEAWAISDASPRQQFGTA